ncbi:pyruvate kinase [Phytohabitans aurantiacus]|nr:pyruvate kinase [Phytohabitans aurantiacus]
MLWYTPGPESIGYEEEIIKAGATGVRLTFSYSTTSYQAERALLHRKIARDCGRDFAVVADIAGEKYRLGRFVGVPSIRVAAGEEFRLITGEVSDPKADRTLTVTTPTFFSGLESGDLITVGDGNTVLEVSLVSAGAASVVVTVNGTVNQSRGLTVQGDHFRPRCLTDKDLSDLRFVAKSDLFDNVALSFVADASDLRRAREILSSSALPVELTAKIETSAGVENAAEISKEADMVMAARGDLALAVPWVELPAAVTRIETAANETGTPWILATQLVEGLERFIIPTRAEICDLANWAHRGCAGVLLSYETAFGARPIDAVATVRSLLDRWSV